MAFYVYAKYLLKQAADAIRYPVVVDATANNYVVSV